MPDARIVATDLNAAMLERARGRVPHVDLRTRRRPGPAFRGRRLRRRRLPVRGDVLSRSARRPAEARRVLRPGGRMSSTCGTGSSATRSRRRSPMRSRRCSPTIRRASSSAAARASRNRRCSPANARDRFVDVEVGQPGRCRNGRIDGAGAAEGLCRGTPLSVEIDAHGVGAMERAIAATTKAIGAAQRKPTAGSTRR